MNIHPSYLGLIAANAVTAGKVGQYLSGQGRSKLSRESIIIQESPRSKLSRRFHATTFTIKERALELVEQLAVNPQDT
jgi:hypothetical protein